LGMPERRPRHVLGARVNRPSAIKGGERQTGSQIARRTASAEAPRCAIVSRVCPTTRIGQSSENLPLGTRAKLFRRCRTHRNSGTSLRQSTLEDSLRHLQGPAHTCSTPRQGTRLLDQDIPHAVTVDSGPAKLLFVFSPAGLEAGIREMGEPARSLTVPPQPEEPPDEAEMERLAAIGARYGAEILGPPPGQ
jgi:hypothetical protein